MKVRKTESERSVRINITLPPATLRALDANLEKLRARLRSAGLPEKDLDVALSRSSIIKTMVETLAQPAGYNLLLGGFQTALGVDLNQTELDLGA